MRERYTARSKKMIFIIKNSLIDSSLTTDNTTMSLRLYKEGKLAVKEIQGDVDLDQAYEEMAQNLSEARQYQALPQRNHQENMITDHDVNQDYSDIYQILDSVLGKISRDYNQLQLSGELTVDKTMISLKNDNNVYLHFEDMMIHGDMTVTGEEADEPLTFPVKLRRLTGEALLEIFKNYLDIYEVTGHIADGAYPVIFSSDDPLPLGKFEKDLQPDMYHSGMSPLSGLAEKKYFHDDFTLLTSLNPDLVGHRGNKILPFFDWEGTVNQRYTKGLIEDGVIRTPYSCKQTAAKYDITNTGSGFGSMDEPPYASPLAFAVKPGNKTLEELLQGETAIYFHKGEGSPFGQRGEFENLYKQAFVYQRGKLIGRLRNVRATSMQNQMFGENYIGMSKDFYLGSDLNRGMVIRMNLVQEKEEK